MLGACKDQHLMPAAFTNDVAEQVALVRLLGQDHALVNQFRSGVASGDRDFLRVVQYAFGQFADFV